MLMKKYIVVVFVRTGYIYFYSSKTISISTVVGTNIIDYLPVLYRRGRSLSSSYRERERVESSHGYLYSFAKITVPHFIQSCAKGIGSHGTHNFLKCYYNYHSLASDRLAELGNSV